MKPRALPRVYISVVPGRHEIGSLTERYALAMSDIGRRHGRNARPSDAQWWYEHALG
jgi:hypothetical protein